MDILTAVNEKGEKIKMEVTPEGSIGLLALGAVGVLLWKKARIEAGLPNFADPKNRIAFTEIEREKPEEGKADEKK